MMASKERGSEGQNLEKRKALSTNKCFNYEKLGHFERDPNQPDTRLSADQPENIISKKPQ